MRQQKRQPNQQSHRSRVYVLHFGTKKSYGVCTFSAWSRGIPQHKRTLKKSNAETLWIHVTDEETVSAKGITLENATHRTEEHTVDSRRIIQKDTKNAMKMKTRMCSQPIRFELKFGWWSYFMLFTCIRRVHSARRFYF